MGARGKWQNFGPVLAPFQTWPRDRRGEDHLAAERVSTLVGRSGSPGLSPTGAITALKPLKVS